MKVKYNEGYIPLRNEHHGFTFIPSNYGQSGFPGQKNDRTRKEMQWLRQQCNQKAVTQWRNMSPATKSAWSNFAAAFPQPTKKDPNKFLTGYQCFIKRNYFCLLNNGILSDFMLEPELIISEEENITIEIRSSNHQIDATELYIKNFGLLPKVGQTLLFYCAIYAEESGHFYESISGAVRVDEVFIDGLFITVNVPDSFERVVISAYLSKPYNPGQLYAGSKIRYMGCFTTKKFTELQDVPAITPADSGKVWGVDETGTWSLIDLGPSKVVHIVNNYTELTNVVNNTVVFDINTQMYYQFKVDVWVNITLNVNLIRIVIDHTTLINVVNNTVVFDLTLNAFFKYVTNVWIEISFGGGGLTCEDLINCPTIIQILEQIETISEIIVPDANISIPPVRFGALYNAYCFRNSPSILKSGWHLPSRTEVQSLESFLGGTTVAGGKLNEPDLDYWLSIFPGTTGSSGLNFRGAGSRRNNGVAFDQFKDRCNIWTSTYVPNTDRYYYLETRYNFLSTNDTQIFHFSQGASIRGIKDTTSLHEGDIGTYVGNDGKVYRTKVVNGQEWIADNLNETKLSDGSLIPVVTDNDEWGAQTEAAMCYYDNNPDYG